MPDPVSSSSAFVASSRSISNLPPLDYDEEFWGTFINLVLEHRDKFTENLSNTLNTLLLFAALFSAVNVGILGLSFPNLSQDTLPGTDIPAPEPSKPSRYANRVFAFCLTCSMIASFFSLVGTQWLTHYKKLGPTAQLENRKKLQRMLDGTIRWHFEGSVGVVLTTVLQLTLILFLVEWVPYLHSQGYTVSYPINGISQFGAFMLLVMFACAAWDPWCPYQTPYTTSIPQAILRLCKNVRVDFRKAVAATRETMSEVRSHPSKLLGIVQRPKETDEVMNIKSLCWMLENAPRGQSLSRVTQHILRIFLSKSRDAERKQIMASPHLFRLHETFWDLLMKIKWISRGNPANVNGNTTLEQLAIFGRAVLCISSQSTDDLLSPSRRKELFEDSFKNHGPKNSTSWQEISPFLKLQVSYTDEGPLGEATYRYNTV